ncbi:MAG TPA: cytochrome C oxidase subunit IV family protein [Terriglobales bacterium]|nr:cytochrome C oxidase subunit IV family protein [Terriglobales bacterium]
MAEHIVSPKLYLAVFATLLCMTGLTWYASTVDLSILVGGRVLNFNPLVALLIAFFKASLVILFFMHVKYSAKLTKIVVMAGFFWLLILLSLTMVDYLSRALLTTPGNG